MKITVAIDSFKGSLTTFEAGEAVKSGIKRVYGDAKVFVLPLADGGEGTGEAIIRATGARTVSVSVSDPLGRKITASYGITPDNTAIIEMAQASGLTLVEEKERDPLYTTTRGVGEMINDAIDKGCRRFIIGIGGSATNDGGVGMLSALGFDFCDENGNKIKDGAIGLKELKTISAEGKRKELSECEFTVACDVKNPLCGKNGCSYIYSPQKGAKTGDIEKMDAWLESYARLTKDYNTTSDKDFPGSGAAGGLGFAFMAYLGGVLRSGTEIVTKAVGLEDKIASSDIVITGEGRLDGQSLMGKAPIGVAQLAKKYNKPVIAFAGSITDDASKCCEYGIDAFFSVTPPPCTLEDAMKTENAIKNLANTAEQAFRLLKFVETK